MKIAIFTETYIPDINGVATHIKTLKDGLEAIGNEVLIVKSDAKSRKHYIEKDVLHCPAVVSKKYYNYNLSSPVSFKRLRLLKQWKPDIIHIQNEFGVGLSGVLMAKILKVPLVYTLHTMYDDYIYYIPYRHLQPLLTNASHKYCELIADNADAVTGASNKIEMYFKKCGVKKNINIIPNAAETEIFNPDKVNKEEVKKIRDTYGLTENTMAACFCGRIAAEKNIDKLLDFWASTVKKSDNFKLLIIGDGPNLDELKVQAKSLGIDDSIIFTGRIEHKNLSPYYSACNVYITASLSENYSISMLEAMASGLPVFHYYDELNENQFIEGVNGFVFKDAQEMYNKLLKYNALSNEEKEELSQKVLNSAKFSGSENMAKYIMAIYNNIIGNHQNAS